MAVRFHFYLIKNKWSLRINKLEYFAEIPPLKRGERGLVVPAWIPASCRDDESLTLFFQGGQQEEILAVMP